MGSFRKGTLEELTAAALDRVYRRGDKLMTLFIVFHSLVAIALAFVYDTWLISITVTVIAASMFLISARLLPGEAMTRVISGVSLQAFVALHIYQLHGMAEMHFFFFTAFTMMIVYQDWASMWAGAVLIILQHLLFALIHNTGTNLYFFTESYVSFFKLFFHFGIAIFHVVICGYWAYLLRIQTINQVKRNMRLRYLLEQSRLQQEELRKANIAAESANRAKSNFLANMSHEIRTPLNGILGVAEIINMESREEGTQEYAGLIKESGDRLLKTINAILDLAKIEAQKVEVHLKKCDVHHIIERVARLMKVLALQKNISLEVVALAAPTCAMIDEDMFSQVISNLVGNAIKFTEHGGVTIVIDRVEGAREKNMISIKVIDTGIGITPQYISELFQPFSQASTGHGRRYQGTGLGLAISKNFIELMGGNISVESEKDSGSVFEVQLPACD